MSLPHFFIVGVPKAGTTALYSYLNQHPQIYLPDFKEPHYFSYAGESLPKWGVKTIDSYRNLFQAARTDQLLGEASTWYLYSATAAEQIYKTLPDAKIIIMLRQPVERAYSSWAFRTQSGWESVRNFKRAVEIEPKRIHSEHEWDFHYINAGFYYPQLKRYFDLFPREQIRVYLQEDLKQNAASVAQDIFQFLGVEGNCDLDFSTSHNVTQFPKQRLVNQFLTKQSPVKSFVKLVVPQGLRRRVSTQVRALNRTKVPPLSSTLKKELTLRYQQDIQKTAKLIDRDLSSWLQDS